MNKVSVIIPCYNDGKYIGDAVKSVKKCKEDLYEIVIVDDGSHDTETIQKIKELEKDGCTVIWAEHKGQSSARNTGAKACRYPYILFLDSDNMINPEYIKKGIKILDENPEVGVVYGNYKKFGIDDHEIRQKEFSIADVFLLECSVDTCSVIRKKVWEDCGGYDENMDMWEDWEFSINVYSKDWEFFHIDELMYYYRIRKDSVNTRSEKRENRLKMLDYTIKKHFPLFLENFEKRLRAFNPHFVNAYYEELKVQKEKNAELQAKILDIERSMFWKIFRLYAKAVDVLLPEGSLFRKVYNFAIQANQNLINKNKKNYQKNLDWPWDKKNVDILFVNHEESLTGAPKMLLEVVKNISKHYDSTMLSLKMGGAMHEEFLKKFEYIIYPEFISPEMPDLQKAIKILRDIKAKMVYANTIASYAYAEAGTKIGIPVVFHVHELKGVFQDYLSLRQIKNFKNIADVFIVPSKAVENYLIDELNVSAQKIFIIPEVIDVKKVIELSRVKDGTAIKEMKKNRGQTTVISIGTVMERKGADLFFKAYKILENKKPGAFKFVWIGNAPFGIKRFFEKARHKNFVYLGEKKNPYPYLKYADIFALPSREDPFPLVVLEALALKKPIVAFLNSGGAFEAAGDFGVSAKNIDEKSLAFEIEKLAENKNLMQSAAQKTILKDDYDSKNLDLKLKKIISNLFAKKYGLMPKIPNAQDKKVSIILPSYNYGWCISEAVDSVLCQTYKNWELIIMDDNSTDNTREILKNYAEKYPEKIKVFNKEKSEQGLALSYKKALELAKGELVAFLEADDAWENDNLEKKVVAMENNPGLACVFSNVSVFGNNKSAIKKKTHDVAWHLKGIAYPDKPFDMQELIKEKICVKSFSAVVVKKEKLKGIKFDADCKIWFDWYFHAQLAKQGKYLYLPEKTVKWRAHSKSYSSDFLNKPAWKEDFMKVAEKVRSL